MTRMGNDYEYEHDYEHQVPSVIRVIRVIRFSVSRLALPHSAVLRLHDRCAQNGKLMILH